MNELYQDNKKQRLKKNRAILWLIGLVMVIALVFVSIFIYTIYQQTKKNNAGAQNLFTAATYGFEHRDVDDFTGFSDYGDTYALSVYDGNLDTEQGQLLLSFIDDYVYDKSVYQASFVVEINKTSKKIATVSYTSHGKTSVFNGETKDDYVPYIAGLSLDNGNVLDLNWRLENNRVNETGMYTYQVDLYNEKNQLKMTLYVNTHETKADTLTGQLENQVSTIECPVKIYTDASDGQQFTEETVTIMAYVDQSYTVHLILDAIDYMAADIEENDQEDGISSKYKETTSAMALFAMTDMNPGENIYSVVSVSNEHEILKSRRSNEENLLMGSVSSYRDQNYYVDNARHLFNMRFIESYQSEQQEKQVTYNHRTSFDWGGDNGIIANGNLYYSGNQSTIRIQDTTYGFRPMASLGENSRFLGRDNVYINDLYVYGQDGDGNLGLFKINKGTVEGIRFKNVIIDGTTAGSVSHVGALCGVNQGSISNVSVTEGFVTGINYVGGIVGRWDSSESVIGLTAEVQVTGQSYVGGIAGGIINYHQDLLLVKDCENKGFISGKGQYIGGIAGYLSGVSLESCSGAPLYMYNVAQEHMNPETYLSDSNIQLFKGNYVGGIAGYIRNSQVDNCKTEEGLIVGGDYVGGIFGTWVNNSNEATIVLDGKGAYNRATVLGDNYVGGIVGVNGYLVYSQEEKAYVVDESAQALTGRLLENWMNAGIILATENYGGGITGYNGGVLWNCGSDMTISEDSDQAYLEKLRKIGATGDYIGGIVGCNNGIITTDGGVWNIEAIVVGENYVGGVVGYNQEDSIVSNYYFADGLVMGHGFVGGFMGLNCSVDLFESDTNGAAPKFVYGKSYVGGFIGGNLVASNTPELSLNTEINSSEGVVMNQGPYTGGVIGINAVYAYTRDMDEEDSLGSLICNSVKMSMENPEDNYKQIANITEEVISSHTVSAREAVHFSIATNHNLTAWNRFGEILLKDISGQVFVGGVIGAHYGSAGIEISYIRNMANITATGSMRINGYNYAYAGAITGLIPETMTIKHCVNSREAEIDHLGDYHGSIGEVNQGRIENCEGVSVFESVDYVGGIVGLNESTGIIVDSIALDHIQGDNYVGGIAAVNEGTIENGTVEGDVTGNGNYVGGIAGLNRGTIHGGSNDNVTISGQSYVGGVVGLHTVPVGVATTIPVIDNFNNQAAVYGQGYGGGIAGASIGNVRISNSSQLGQIDVTSGYMGGITGFNGIESVISRCRQTTPVSSPQAAAVGGIVGVNQGRVEQCTVCDNANVSGSTYIGGVAGINSGVITLTTVTNISVTLQGGTMGNGVGGIAGINSGSILNTGSPVRESTGNYPQPVTVSSNTFGSYVGGIVGLNKGRIQGTTQSGSRTALNAYVVLRNNCAAYIGGIAGKNNNLIEDYIFNGYVEAAGSNDYGIGGIVGVNGNEEIKDWQQSSMIRNCVVNDYRLNDRDFSETNRESAGNTTISVTATAKVRVGGIAGYNCADGIVEASTLRQCYIRGEFGYIGGIAGWNKGCISDCYGETTKGGQSVPNKVKIYVSNGVVGGLVGKNSDKGIITESSTGADWVMMAAEKVTTSGSTLFPENIVGGCIGYELGQNQVSNLINYATVSGGEITGGIIGKSSGNSLFRMISCTNYGDILNTQIGKSGSFIGYREGQSWMLINSNDYTEKSVEEKANE